MKLRHTLLFPLSLLFCLLTGVLIGAFFFLDTQQRPIVDIERCKTDCLDRKELLGLVGSVFVQKMPGFIPDVVLETDRVVVLNYPDKKARVHYVVVPKRDIRDAGSLAAGDEPYIDDMFFVMAKIIQDEKLEEYTISTNGPGYQEVGYLHFHLVAE